MAAALAIGILMGSYLILPTGAIPFILGALLLSIVAFWLLRHGLAAFFSLCLCFLLLGFVRSQLPTLALLPDTLLYESAMLLQRTIVHLHSLGLSPTCDSLVTAMLLGSRETLTHETIELYRHTGASHILALSGLHLSVLFGLLNFFLLRLINYRLRYVFGWIGIAGIWGYAMLTGFPVSLCRASLMMTLLLIAEMNYIECNSWDTLGITVLCLLLLSPDMLFDVGFQLSFTAVIGILLFYRPLSRLWQPRSALLKWLWRAWSVSFAAQIFTLPLLLHYFRFFSVSGIVMSPIYILLASGILLTAMFLMFISLFSGGHLLKYVLETLVSVQHSLMGGVNRLSIDKLVISEFSSTLIILWYAAMLCLLPPLWAIQPADAKPKGYRLAMFFRQWPYLLAFLLLITTCILQTM